MPGRVFAVVVSGVSFFTLMIVGEIHASSADEHFAKASDLAANGAFEDSVMHWKTAEALFAQAQNTSRQIDTQVRLAAAYYSLGQTRLAAETLAHAERLTSPADEKHLAKIKAALGAIYI